jgi:hypothetical protein
MNKHTRSQRVRRAIAAVVLLTGTGCATSQSSPAIPPASGAAISLSSLNSSAARTDDSARCNAFESTFDEWVACRRADGTLQSFSNPIGWRVRYFVRYQQMPCQEAPTVKEGYVFHMVTNDLYNDEDLNDAQRLAIRNSMFDGTVHCR